MAAISLCMIGQDEAGCVLKNLLTCLPYVSEVIFIDGGSKDNTIALIRAAETTWAPVKIFEIPFEQHFAKQKNEAVKRATGDYILFKDCDEIFELDALANLQRLTKYEPYIEYDAFAFRRKTYVDGLLMNLGEDDSQIRFWPNGKGIHFEGRLHEGVTGYDNLMFLNVWIIHDKTAQMQQKDNELYWDMGQPPPEGWKKEGGVWLYESREANNDTG